MLGCKEEGNDLVRTMGNLQCNRMNVIFPLIYALKFILPARFSLSILLAICDENAKILHNEPRLCFPSRSYSSFLPKVSSSHLALC